MTVEMGLEEMPTVKGEQEGTQCGYASGNRNMERAASPAESSREPSTDAKAIRLERKSG